MRVRLKKNLGPEYGFTGGSVPDSVSTPEFGFKIPLKFEAIEKLEGYNFMKSDPDPVSNLGSDRIMFFRMAGSLTVNSFSRGSDSDLQLCCVLFIQEALTQFI